MGIPSEILEGFRACFVIFSLHLECAYELERFLTQDLSSTLRDGMSSSFIRCRDFLFQD